ncbi:MAG: ATP-binding cassette domain-containing protein [Synergistaceae bacterium]|jgi:oligopeptide/dipeptide ABC transporter ATP-binding protein|nr:ATP-binding cassette domain-containing protein [Synergistaceae bacterium]
MSDAKARNEYFRGPAPLTEEVARIVEPDCRSERLLEVKGLKKWFRSGSNALSRSTGHIRAVDGVDMTADRGETVALVGESGCGKSTLGRAIVRLLAPTSGSVWFDGDDLAAMNGAALQKKRRDMQFIFQDPFASLDPRMTIGDVIGEPLDIHRAYRDRSERASRIKEIMETVGLNPGYASRYAHEFSGGQRQRIGIARAIALNPKMIVCDEPVSALDVSIQAQIINLLKSLQKKFGMAYIFISHDLNVVRHISDRVNVMYLGKFVETASKRDLFEAPSHPYTKALLSAIPIYDPRVKREKILLRGDLPSPADPPPGCHFHTRCPVVTDICREVAPGTREVARGHFCACHRVKGE